MNLTKEFIIEWYGGHDYEELLFADGLDEAIIGIDPASFRIVYSRTKAIKIMMRQMEEEEAMEYLEYNTFNAWMGDKTPIWVDDTMWAW
jgi:hypothetical protein